MCCFSWVAHGLLMLWMWMWEWGTKHVKIKPAVVSHIGEWSIFTDENEEIQSKSYSTVEVKRFTFLRKYRAPGGQWSRSTSGGTDSLERERSQDGRWSSWGSLSEREEKEERAGEGEEERKEGEGACTARWLVGDRNKNSRGLEECSG